MRGTEQSGARLDPTANPSVDLDAPDQQFNVTTARLLRREALRRAAEELNITSPLGLEDALERISAEVTAQAVYRHATVAGNSVLDVTDAAAQKNKAPRRE